MPGPNALPSALTPAGSPAAPAMLLVHPVAQEHSPDAASAVDEANHRIANQLQLLGALIAYEARELDDPTGRAVLERTRLRLAAVSVMHRQLCEQQEGDVDLGDYLEDLGQQIALTCPDHRRILVDAQSVPVSGRTATSMGLLATELVTNARKHAYRADEPGDILITLRRLQDGSHCFAVEDRGKGHADASSHSFGSRLVAATVKSLSARASMEDALPGTRFRMILRF